MKNGENSRVDGIVKKEQDEGVQTGHFACLYAPCVERLISQPDLRGTKQYQHA